jgi:hypothetical protein
VAGDREYRVGDRVVCLKNRRAIGLLNGLRGEVTSIDPVAWSIVFRLHDGTERSVPTGYLEAGHVDHGYAMTIHKAQGLTADQALVLATDDLYHEAGYTSDPHSAPGFRRAVLHSGPGTPRAGRSTHPRALWDAVGCAGPTISRASSIRRSGAGRSSSRDAVRGQVSSGSPLQTTSYTSRRNLAWRSRQGVGAIPHCERKQ